MCGPINVLLKRHIIPMKQVPEHQTYAHEHIRNVYVGMAGDKPS